MQLHMIAFLYVFAACVAVSQANTISLTTVNVTLKNEQVTVAGETYEHFTLSKIEDSISLRCTLTSSTEIKDANNLIFSFRNVLLNKTYANSNEITRYYVTSPTVIKSTTDSRVNVSADLVIKVPYGDDMSNYECEVKSGEKSFGKGKGGFYSMPIVQLKVDGKNTRDVPRWNGDGLTVYCDAQGFPKPHIWWTKSFDPRFKSINQTLILKDLSGETDRGYLICTAMNKYGKNFDKIFLRVKNGNAFVLPLIILFVEIVIMAAIIGGYEIYMRKKRE